MGKIIKIKDKDTDNTYTLEYNRKAVEFIEKQGFIPSEAMDKPMTMLPLLFRGAFVMHHPTIKQPVVDRLLESTTKKTDLFAKLIDMYNETLETLIVEDGEGNVEWEASF